MNKKGVTILELLISISFISIILLLLMQVMMSLNNINNDPTYASEDEIQRTQIIKNIEESFIEEKLNGLSVKKETNQTIITFFFENGQKDLMIEEKNLTYNETYELESNKATYDLNPVIEKVDLEDNYYYLTITIPVLIDKENTSMKDDIVLTYLGLEKENTYFSY